MHFSANMCYIVCLVTYFSVAKSVPFTLGEAVLQEVTEKPHLGTTDSVGNHICPKRQQKAVKQ